MFSLERCSTDGEPVYDGVVKRKASRVAIWKCRRSRLKVTLFEIAGELPNRFHVLLYFASSAN